MGNCCGGEGRKGDAPVNESEQKLVAKAHPEETDREILNRYLRGKQEHARFTRVEECIFSFIRFKQKEILT
jgi:hypothetical protein